MGNKNLIGLAYVGVQRDAIAQERGNLCWKVSYLALISKIQTELIN